MEIDLIDSLKFALEQLNRFSIPRVGTFERKRLPAKVDHKSGKIQPPASSFEISQGEAHTEELRSFFRKKYNTNDSTAAEIVKRISLLVSGDLEVNDKFEIPGIGTIEKDKSGDLSFRQTATADPDSFGLTPVALSRKAGKAGAGDSPENQKEKKLEAAKRAVKKDAPAEKPEPVRRRAWLVPVILVILLVSLTVGGYFLRDDLREFAIANNWLTLPDDSTADDSGDDGQLADSDDSANDTNNTAEDPGNTNDGTDVNDKPDDSASDDYSDPDPTPDYSSFDGNTITPENGTFYLIVASMKNPAVAQNYIENYPVEDLSLSLVAPLYEGGWYKVSIYSSTNKDEVIQKMVQTKDILPGKSWIYYNGIYN